jgi:aminodeoxyfutalosine synthase
VAQIALRFGADDVDGTIVHETIYHAAGSTSPQGLTRDLLIRLIREAGFAPVERDTYYGVIEELPRAAVPEGAVKVKDRKANKHLEVLS